MPDKVIRVYVFDRNERPIPDAQVSWTFKHEGETITCGPVTTQGFTDKPVDIQIEGELDEPFVDITAKFKRVTKTDRIPVDKRDHTFKLNVALPKPADSEQQQPESNPLAAALYGLLAIVGLVGSVVIGWYLLNNPGLLGQNNASPRAYFVLLLLLGLSSAAFLFGAMRSTASLRGSHLGAAYEFGGPVVIAIVVVLGGFQLTKTPENVSLVVRLRAKEPINGLTDSWVRVDLGFRRDRRDFGGDGDAVIPDVPSSLVGQKVAIEFSSMVYRLASPQPSYPIPTNTVVYLDVERIPPPPPPPPAPGPVTFRHPEVSREGMMFDISVTVVPDGRGGGSYTIRFKWTGSHGTWSGNQTATFQLVGANKSTLQTDTVAINRGGCFYGGGNLQTKNGVLSVDPKLLTGIEVSLSEVSNRKEGDC